MLIPYDEHRKAMEQTYEGICTVIVREYTRLPGEVRETLQEVTKYENKPCRISFVKGSTTEGMVQKANQTVVLFVYPEVKIPTGSKVIVTQAGETMEFSKSGIARSYNSHKEYDLEAFTGWN